MSRPSKIDKLDSAIRDKIAEWRLAGRSIDEIMAACFAEFPDVPADAWPVRSGFGAHIEGLDKLVDLVWNGRKIAEALMGPLEGAPEHRQSRANIETMHGIITQFLMAKAREGKDGEPVVLPAKDVAFICGALNDLATARAKDSQTTVRLMREFAAEQNGRVDRAAAEIAKTAHEAGLSAERIKELQAKVAGLRIEPDKAAA